MKLAILLGISEYDKIGKLPEVRNDLEIFAEIMQLDPKTYDKVIIIDKKSTSNEILNEILNISNDLSIKKYEIEELLFYYSGHGMYIGNEFCFLTEKYESERVNECALQDKELNEYLKTFLNPASVIKIIDACRTTSEMKDYKENVVFDSNKISFTNFIGIYSSDINQKSLLENAISSFTYEIYNCILETPSGKELNYSNLIDYLRKKFDSRSNNFIQRPKFDLNSTFVNANFIMVSEPLKQRLYKKLVILGVKNDPNISKYLILSDLNYSHFDNNGFSWTRIFNYLIEFISENPVDLIIIIGNITGKSRLNLLHEVLNILEDKIFKKFRIPIFFGCGPNDLDLDSELDMTKQFFSTSITDNEILNKFIKRENDEQYQISIRNLKTYNSIIKKEIAVNNNVKFGDLFYTYLTKNEEKGSVGIAHLNSSWKYKEKNSKITAIIPPATVYHSLKSIQASKIKVFISYFPLKSLDSYNRYEIETIVYDNFDITISTDYESLEGDSNYLNGSLSIFSNRKFFNNSEKDIGFQMLKIKIEDCTAELTDYCLVHYEFKSIKNTNFMIPKNNVKTGLKQLRIDLLAIYEKELLEANQLLVSYSEKDKGSFIELFTEPVLKTKNKKEYYISKNDQVFDFWKLMETGNYIIHGGDKSGKTSALKRLMLEYLNGFSKFKTLPLYIDFESIIKNRANDFTILKKLKEYYGGKVLNPEYGFIIKILIDNVRIDKSAEFLLQYLLTLIHDFSKSYPLTSYIITIEEDNYIAKTENKKIFSNLNFQHIYIHEISKRHIRELTLKWPNISAQKKDDAVEKILSIFKQFNMPLNYWTVSLFLWVYNQSLGKKIVSNYDLIDLHIDKILEKDTLVFESSSSMSFSDYKDLLAKLSHILYTCYYNQTYSISYVDLIKFLEQYQNDNRRVYFKLNDLVDYITKAGVLKEKEGYYSFRLRGVFEYFLAMYMNQNKEFKEELMSKPELYLAFANEFELYSNFKRDDDAFLNQVHQVVMQLTEKPEIYKQLSKSPEENMIRINSDLKEIFVKSFFEGNDILLGESSDEEIEEIMESSSDSLSINSEVVLKRITNLDIVTSTKLLGFYHLLSRIYRSAVLVNDKNDAVFQSIIENSCNLIFYSIEEEKSRGVNFDKKYVQLIGSLAPLFTQLFLYDAIGHRNLGNIILSLIKKYKTNLKENYFKIFVLYFLYIDSSSPDELNNEGILNLEELFKETPHNVKESIILKLIAYVKIAKLTSETKDKLIKKIEKFLEIENPKASKNSIQKYLIDLHRTSLARGNLSE